ncbi:hypothetical protein QTO34_004450 [Cnephaeus nilssonii]|uniref:Uncharacterized protein n=1 Tax=Cnephaeus nilssonii TaxID=3371016 RepID=A0AA40HPB5_CNENI|nr:hypothetical protein QTO34_004450 [Eptesicus nilssonii]
MRQMFLNKEKETELELTEKEREIHEVSANLQPVHHEEMQEVEENALTVAQELAGVHRAVGDRELSSSALAESECADTCMT